MDKTAKVWDAKNAAVLFTLKGHTDKVTSACFSPDGTRILTASFDKTVRVWDAKTQAQILVLKGIKDLVYSARYSPDGTRIVTAGNDNLATVWDAENGDELQTLKGHFGKVLCAEFNSDGSQVVTGSDDKTIKLWDVQNGTELLTIKGHADAINDVSFGLDDTRILSASTDRSARVWNARTGLQVNIYADAGPMKAAVYTADGTRIVTCGREGSKVWDAHVGDEMIAIRDPSSSVSSMAFSPDGTRLVMANGAKHAVVWDARTGRELLKLQGHGEIVSRVAYGFDGQRIATGSRDGSVRIWDALSGKELLSLPIPAKSRVDSIFFSQDGVRIAAGSRGEARIWELKSGKLELMLKDVTPLTFNSTGLRLYGSKSTRMGTAYTSHTCVWDVGSGAELAVVWMNEVGVSSNGPRIVTSDSVGPDRGSRVTRYRLRDLSSEGDPVELKRWGVPSADGKRIISENEGKLEVFDAGTGALLLSLRAASPISPGSWRTVAVSPDGSRIATSGGDETTRIWYAGPGNSKK